MSLPAFQVKKKQYLYAGAAGLLGLTLIVILILSIEHEVKPQEQTPLQETNITTAAQRINSQEVWVERIESENKLTQKKLDALEKVLNESIKNTADHEDYVQQRLEEIDQRASERPSEYHDSSGQVLPPSPSESNGEPSSSGLRKIILKLSPVSLELSGKKASSSKLTPTLEDTLPAGTFAKAILLGGVDASTSITSSSDPRPVLLRLMDEGNLPRKFKSDLKDCHILASSYGDLSSERVYMRLEKLTCTERLTGEISETQVAGYVLGEDGRAGVRGVVTDKAGPLVRNSLVGGFFSGMGQFFGAQQQSSIFPVSPFGQARALSPQQMLTAGASQGLSSAMEKYADFFIKRAEQLQPVLQVAAGREVDIVFTQGTQFGETTAQKALNKIRNQSRKQAVQNLEAQEDSQNWLPQPTQDGDEL